NFFCYHCATHIIKQLFVFHGRASALLGAIALVVLINIFTKNDHEDYNNTEIQVELGTENSYALSMVAGKRAGSARLSGSFRIARSDGYDFNKFVRDTVNFSEGMPSILKRAIFYNNNEYKNESMAIPVSGKFSYKGFYIGTDSYYQESAKGLENVSLDYNSQRDHRLFLMNYIGWQKNFKEKHFFNAEYQRTKEWLWGGQPAFRPAIFDSLVKSGRNPNAPITHAEIATYFSEYYSQQDSRGSTRDRVNLLYQTVAKNDINLTVGYLFDRLDILGVALSDYDRVPYFNDKTDDKNFLRRPFFVTTKNALFLQAKKPFFNEKLYTTLGIRYDHHNIYKGVVNLRSGFVFVPTKDLFIKALFGQAFREPNIFELGAGNPKGANLGLKPARMNALELSITKQFQDILQLMGTIYRSQITDFIVPFGTNDFTNSKEKQYVVGGEVSAILRYGKWNADANYTYTNPYDQEYAGQIVNALNNYPHRANVGVTYDITKKISLNARINYFSKIEAYHGNRNIERLHTIDAFTRLHLTLSSKDIFLGGILFKGMITVQNVLNSTDYQPNVRRGGPKQFQLPGRQVFLRTYFKF
ncbi:MAG: hypothetical protein NZ521_06115, partial [Flammeovirgaceae bacterium]|nr:hypothetical protein [Flammeovirgaceae bacterium]MDW8287810.1 hypothetical protein [Flammeovirgaceae bacterium]